MYICTFTHLLFGKYMVAERMKKMSKRNLRQVLFIVRAEVVKAPKVQ